jgi:hypothetical protein
MMFPVTRDVDEPMVAKKGGHQCKLLVTKTSIQFASDLTLSAPPTKLAE